MRIIDFHVHLADPAWQAQDPFFAATRGAYRLVEKSLPPGARAALELAGGALDPVRRSVRDRALELVSWAMAGSRNRTIYLGPLGARLAKRAEGLLQASFLRATPENLLAALDAGGITSACVLPVAPHTTTELVLSLAQTPRLIPFCSIAPGTPDPGDRVAAYKKRGCRGVKIHPTLQDSPPESAFYHEIAEAAAALDLPIVAHTGTICFEKHPHGEWSGARAYEPLLRAHPGARFVLAHMNLFDPEEALAVARANENVWLDTSWQPEGIVRRAAREVGDRRLLFASDWPFLGAEPAAALRIVERALSGRTDALENVLFRNAEELLGMRAAAEKVPGTFSGRAS